MTRRRSQTNVPDWVTNDFLRTHLLYTQRTESPTLMQVWSALASASACMGRHIYLPFGIGDIYPNIFVLLVGPPATRKTQAIKYASKIVKKHTGVRFAPSDTSGQRQGLIMAMAESSTSDAANPNFDFAGVLDHMSVMDNILDAPLQAGQEDRHQIFVCASEFGSFLGQNSLDMTRFLIQMWDGEDYTYKLKNDEQVLLDPLMTLIGGTTATDIATLIPPEAMGQGFMSRIILVGERNRRKRIARPKLDLKLQEALGKTYHALAHKMRGAMAESEEAMEFLDSLYEVTIDLKDSRFVYYAERRHMHLIKCAMILCAARGSMQIEKSDIQQAEDILSRTELTMPEALGEFGLSPIALAKHKLVEFIEHANGPVTFNVLWAIMQRDMKMLDFRNSLADLTNANKIKKVTTSEGTAYVFNSLTNDLMNLLDESPLTEAKKETQDESPGIAEMLSNNTVTK